MKKNRLKVYDGSTQLLRAILLLMLLFGKNVRADVAADPTPPKPGAGDVVALFESGNEKFRAGIELAKSDRAAADAKFREAAGAWREVARIGGIRNAKLETNIANASLLAGDVPGAILAFRKALKIDPTDPAVQAGLAAARRSAGTEALARGSTAPAKDEAGRSGGLRGTINALGSALTSASYWAAGLIAPRSLLILGIGLYVTFFLGASLRVLGWMRIPGYVLAAIGVAALLVVGPAAVREIQASRHPEAVVFASNVIARSGPAELYDPAFQEPLRSGLEVEITEKRGPWIEIRLRDGRKAWIRADSIREI